MRNVIVVTSVTSAGVLMRRMLESPCHCAVHVAEDSNAAKRIYAEVRALIASDEIVIVSDVQTRPQTGPALVGELRRQTGDHIPALFVTGGEPAIAYNLMREEKCTDCWLHAKPIQSVAVFADLVSRLLVGETSQPAGTRP